MPSKLQLLGMSSRVSMLARQSTRSGIYASMRDLATAAKVKEVLPLKGIKVLDMTRVLAGVSFFFIFLLFLSCPSRCEVSLIWGMGIGD
jgi:hypothetical protein